MIARAVPGPCSCTATRCWSPPTGAQPGLGAHSATHGVFHAETSSGRATIAGMEAIDYEHIRQLLGRYNLAIDLGDAEGWAATFTSDGVFQCRGLPDEHPLGGRYEGTDALIAYARTHHHLAKGRARHWNANLLIEGDGETATMRCYLLALTAGAGKVAGTTGIYEDRLRKLDGQWRFVERLITIDTPA